MQYGYEHRRSEFKGGNEASPRTVQEAELAFYDAMALYGHESAEALVAERIWKEQRRLVANRIWQEQRRAEQGSKSPLHRQIVANDNRAEIAAGYMKLGTNRENGRCGSPSRRGNEFSSSGSGAKRELGK